MNNSGSKISFSPALSFVTVVVAGVLVCILNGCEAPLFPESLPRSPYERYMVLRGQDPEARSQNSHGVEQNNLRERLKPLGSP